MKMTKANIVKLLQAMSDNKQRLQKIEEQIGDKEYSKRCRAEWVLIEEIISLMNNKSFFDELWKIYIDKQY